MLYGRKYNEHVYGNYTFPQKKKLLTFDVNVRSSCYRTTRAV